MSSKNNYMDLNFDLHRDGKTMISNVEASRLEGLVGMLATIDSKIPAGRKITNGVDTIILLEIDEAKGFKLLDHFMDLFPELANKATYFSEAGPRYDHLVSEPIKMGFTTAEDSAFKGIWYRPKDGGSINEKIARKAAIKEESLLSNMLAGHANIHDIYAFSLIVADACETYDSASDTWDNPYRAQAIKRLNDSDFLDCMISETHLKSNNYSAYHGNYFSTVMGAKNTIFEVQIYTESEWEQTRDGSNASHAKYKESMFKDKHTDEGYQVVIFQPEEGLDSEYFVHEVSSPFVRKAHIVTYHRDLDLLQDLLPLQVASL
jgi:hypothetical protein